MTSLTRIGAIATKEFKHLARDPRMVAVVLIVPVIELLLFAFAISFDVRDVKTVIIDLDHTSTSRQYVQKYQASTFFDVIGRADSVTEVDPLFRADQARVAVVIQPGFARDIASGGSGKVGVFLDGSDPNASRIGRTFVIALNRLYGQSVAAQWADVRGLSSQPVGGLEPHVRTWYNPELKSSTYLIPGLMVVIVMLVTVQQTAVTLVRERDQGTLEQMRVSPLRNWELMVGKLLPWTVLAFIDMTVIVALGLFAFGVPLTGNPLVLAVAGVAFVFACLAMGLVVSAIAPSMATANVIAMLLSFLPAFLLSGFAFSLPSLPVVVQWLSYLFPGRYMVEISRGVFLKGAGFSELSTPLWQLGLYSLIALVVATTITRRRAA